jgi:formylglycine-generating enzyme required for sulfatase activity
MKTSLFTCTIVVALIRSASATVTMDWVSIGDINNAADPLTGYGPVAYEYKIGKYEVTNAQYGAFLNAKGQSNSNRIYNSNMSSYGITQTGSSGSFTYSVTSGFENKPIVFVSWFDAARFTNWLANGQGGSDTESGSYNLMDATTGIISVNPGAKTWIPTEDEWYKAAYYNAATSSYSLYPNGRNVIDTTDTNYDSSGSTDVGSYTTTPSRYGTFDQGGNVYEWNNTVDGSSRRGLRGGSWYDGSGVINSLGRADGDIPTRETFNFGFRVASVPEPTSMVLTMLASGMMLIRRKR